MTLPWSLITILRLLSKVYRLKCLKFETKTHSLTHLLTRVKSRDVFLNTHPSLVTTLIIDAVMTLLIVISMPTKMTIFNDTYPRYMIHDQWWWHMMIIMIYDTWYMMTMIIYVFCFMIWYDMFNLDIWWSWWYMIHDDDIYCWTCLIFMLMLMLDLWLQAQTPGVTHFRAYHRPPDGHF